MSKISPEHIVQIIPLTHDVFAVYRNDDGSEFATKVLVVALTSDGNVHFLDADSEMGLFSDPTGNSNFERYDGLTKI